MQIVIIQFQKKYHSNFEYELKSRNQFQDNSCLQVHKLGSEPPKLYERVPVFMRGQNGRCQPSVSVIILCTYIIHTHSAFIILFSTRQINIIPSHHPPMSVYPTNMTEATRPVTLASSGRIIHRQRA